MPFALWEGRALWRRVLTLDSPPSYHVEVNCSEEWRESATARAGGGYTSVDLAELRKIIALVEKSDIHELEIEEEGRRIRISKRGQEVPPSNPAPTVIPLPAAATVPMELPATPPSASEKRAEAAEPATAEPGVDIVAPMIGTFYRAPAPEAPPYVQVGDTVTPDSIVCIIEAMKVMNEIKAGVSGRIVDVLVENAQPVEFSQPLFRVASE